MQGINTEFQQDNHELWSPLLRVGDPSLDCNTELMSNAITVCSCSSVHWPKYLNQASYKLNWQKNCTSQNSWLIWSDLILLLHQGQQDNFQIEDCSAELLLKYESLLQVLLEKLTYWNQQRGLVLKKEENWKRTLNYGLPLQEVFSFAMI